LFKIGGSIASTDLSMEVYKMAITKGPSRFRKGNPSTACIENTPLSTCNLELMGLNIRTCLICATTSPEAHHLAFNPPRLDCGELDPTYPGIERPSIYSPTIHDYCPANQFLESGSCQPCDPDCSNCVGSSANECTGCVDVTLDVPPPAGGPCSMTCYSTCASCTNPAYNSCNTCQGGNNHDPALLTCTPSTCNTLNGYYYDFTQATCEPCTDSNCLICPGANSCSQCASNYVYSSSSNLCELINALPAEVPFVLKMALANNVHQTLLFLQQDHLLFGN